MFGSKTKNNKKLPAKDKGKSTLPTNLMSRSGQVISKFAHLSDAELDAQLAPHLVRRNIPSKAVEQMKRQQKEQLLERCIESQTEEVAHPDAAEIVQRFNNIKVASADNLGSIITELRSLRVFAGTTDLNWLDDFYIKGGTVAYINVLVRMATMLEDYLRKPQRSIKQTQECATVIHECIHILRSLFNTAAGIDNCFGPELGLSDLLFDLLYICNLSNDECFNPVVNDLIRLLKALPAYESTNKNVGPIIDTLLQGLDTVAKERNLSRFAVIIKCFKWKGVELHTLQLLLPFFNMVEGSSKARIYWRHEFWNSGLAEHFENLSELALKNSEIRELLDPIIKDYEQDIHALKKENVEKDKQFGVEEIYKTLLKASKQPYSQILIKDIFIYLSMICENDSEPEAFKDLCAVRMFLSYSVLFSGGPNSTLPAQNKFIEMIQNSTMESDTLRLHDRLQKTVDEKQQAKALQNVYYTSLRQLEEENLKLREHIEDPTKPIPPHVNLDLQSPKRSDNTTSNQSPAKALLSTSSNQETAKSSSSATIPPPPPLPNLKAGPPPAPPLPNLKSGAPPAPPLPNLKSGPPLPPPLPNLKAGANKSIPQPPAPLGAPILTTVGIKGPASKLPSYLKEKQDKMVEVPTKKLASWEDHQIPPKSINENSLWVMCQDDEKKFGCEKVYADLVKNFSRPKTDSQKVAPFKRTVKNTVVVHDKDKLKGWEILSARKIKDANEFKRVLIEIDKTQINEEIIMLVQEKLLDDSVFEKLRETPIEKFKDAPDGEILLAVLSRLPDLRQRLRAIHLILTFQRECDNLRSQASSIAEACDQLKNSSGLKQFLCLVLVCCNYLLRTQTKRSICYGYLMSLLPKLIETKDIGNKFTLLDHLLIIFDQITAGKFSAFGMNDFIHVEKARSLEFSNVVDSINKLNNQVNAIKNYQANFKKLAVTDKMGQVLDESMPDFLTKAQNLMHLKQSVESKVAELETYFSYDSKKYKLENLFKDIYTFTVYYKNSYEKIAPAAPKTARPLASVLKDVPADPNVPVFARQDIKRGLLEQLEEQLENKKYRPHIAPTRQGIRKFRGATNKENMEPGRRLMANDPKLESLCSRVRNL